MSMHRAPLKRVREKVRVQCRLIGAMIFLEPCHEAVGDWLSSRVPLSVGDLCFY